MAASQVSVKKDPEDPDSSESCTQGVISESDVTSHTGQPSLCSCKQETDVKHETFPNSVSAHPEVKSETSTPDAFLDFHESSEGVSSSHNISGDVSQLLTHKEEPIDIEYDYVESSVTEVKDEGFCDVQNEKCSEDYSELKITDVRSVEEQTRVIVDEERCYRTINYKSRKRKSQVLPTSSAKKQKIKVKIHNDRQSDLCEESEKQRKDLCEEREKQRKAVTDCQKMMTRQKLMIAVASASASLMVPGNTTSIVSTSDDQLNMDSCFISPDSSSMPFIYPHCSCDYTAAADTAPGGLVYLKHTAVFHFMNKRILTFIYRGEPYMSLLELNELCLLPPEHFFLSILPKLSKAELKDASSTEMMLLHKMYPNATIESCSNTLITPYGLSLVYKEAAHNTEIVTAKKYIPHQDSFFYLQNFNHRCPWTLLITPTSDDDGLARLNSLLESSATKSVYKPRILASRKKMGVAQPSPRNMNCSVNEVMVAVIEQFGLQNYIEPYCKCKASTADLAWRTLYSSEKAVHHQIFQLLFMKSCWLYCWVRTSGIFVSVQELKFMGLLPWKKPLVEDMLLGGKEEKDRSRLSCFEVNFLKPFASSVTGELNTCLISVKYLSLIYNLLAKYDNSWIPYAKPKLFMKLMEHSCSPSSVNEAVQKLPVNKQAPWSPAVVHINLGKNLFSCSALASATRTLVNSTVEQKHSVEEAACNVSENLTEDLQAVDNSLKTQTSSRNTELKVIQSDAMARVTNCEVATKGTDVAMRKFASDSEADVTETNTEVKANIYGVKITEVTHASQNCIEMESEERNQKELLPKSSLVENEENKLENKPTQIHETNRQKLKTTAESQMHKGNEDPFAESSTVQHSAGSLILLKQAHEAETGTIKLRLLPAMPTFQQNQPLATPSSTVVYVKAGNKPFKNEDYPRACRCQPPEFPFEQLSFHQCVTSHRVQQYLMVNRNVGKAILVPGMLDMMVCTFFKHDQYYFSVGELQKKGYFCATTDFNEIPQFGPDNWFLEADELESKFLRQQKVNLKMSRFGNSLISAELLCHLTRLVGKKIKFLNQANICLLQIGHVCPDKSSLAYAANKLSEGATLAWRKNASKPVVLPRKASSGFTIRVVCKGGQSGIHTCNHSEKETKSPSYVQVEACNGDTNSSSETALDSTVHSQNGEDYGIALRAFRLVPVIRTNLQAKASKQELIQSDFFMYNPTECSKKGTGLNDLVSSIGKHFTQNWFSSLRLKIGLSQKEEMCKEFERWMQFEGKCVTNADSSEACSSVEVDVRSQEVDCNFVMSSLGAEVNNYWIVLIGHVCCYDGIGKRLQTFAAIKLQDDVYISWNAFSACMNNVELILQLGCQLNAQVIDPPPALKIHLAEKAPYNYRRHNANPWISVRALRAIYWMAYLNDGVTLFPKTFYKMKTLFVDPVPTVLFKGFVLIKKKDSRSQTKQ